MALQPQSRLDDSAFAVLGLIALRGPSTAYERQARSVGRITDEFWPVPHVTPYRVTAELERLGMLTAEQERRRPSPARLLADGRRSLGAPGVALGADERDDDDPRSRPASPPLRRAGRPCRRSPSSPARRSASTRPGSRRSTRRRRGSPTTPSARRASARCGSAARSTTAALDLLELGRRGARLARFLGSVGRSGR